MELDNLRFGKFLQCLCGESLILDSHIGFPTATVIFAVGVRAWISFFFEHEVSLGDGIRSLLSWIVQLIAKCQHKIYLR